ncbi:MAG: type II secretion system protein [Myxococcota bacterium]
MLNNSNPFLCTQTRVRPLHTPPRPMLRRSQAGFTLLELMVVVSIVGLTVAIALPGMGRARVEAKSNELALELVRLGRQGRAAAAGYGRAHLFRFDADLFGRGGVRLFRGINNNCNTNDWPTITGPGCNGNLNCLAEVNPVNWEAGSIQYQVILDGLAGGDVDVCFEPNGTTRWRQGFFGRFVVDNISTAAVGGNAQGGIRFRIQRSDGNGVARRMVIPLGGDARIVR